MLDYKILDYKKKLSKNGEQYIDLLSKSFNSEITGMGRAIIVNKYYVARPDLISLAMYGEDRYADAICKLNGISNPFELNEDMVLYIPSPEYIENFAKNYPDTSTIISADDATDELVKQQESFQKKIDDVRSPSQQLIGDSNFVIDKSLGLVIY